MSVITRLLVWLWVVALVAPLGCKTSNRSGEAAASASATAEVVTSAPSATAPAASAAPSAEPKKKTASRPFLYQVEGQGNRKGSGWLLGTIHMGGDPDEDLHPVVWQRFGASKTVVIEADIGSLGPMEAAKLSMLPPGESLKDELTDAQFEALSDMAGMFVMDSVLERMKPGFALALVVKELLPKKTQPMDLVVQRRAREQGKKLDYLETVEEQVAMMDEAIDAEVLADAIDHADEMKERLGDLSQAYLAGDEPALVEAAFDPDEMEEHPEMFQRMFYARNEAWAKKLQPLLHEGGVFIAVGAGHLVGDRSLVELLRKAGWKVTRVDP